MRQIALISVSTESTTSAAVTITNRIQTPLRLAACCGEPDDVRLHDRGRRLRQHVAQEEDLEHAQEVLEDRELRDERERHGGERHEAEQRREREAAGGARPADAVQARTTRRTSVMGPTKAMREPRGWAADYRRNF